jgi:hypothetical protein
VILNLFSRKRTGPPAEGRFSFAAVGYPKVGNTWLRFMIGRYVQKLGDLPELPLLELEANAPRLLSQAVGPSAAGYFTHAPLVWTEQTADDLTRDSICGPFRSQKVILLIRHPLDVVVSHYMHNQFKNAGPDKFAGTLCDFIEDPVFGLRKLLRFYELWRELRGEVPDLLLWRYEDARKDPLNSLYQIIRFLDLPMDSTAAEEAVRFSSFENMKQMESSGPRMSYKSSGFVLFGAGDRSNPNAYHVRSGKVGGYQTMFSPEHLERYERIIGEQLSEFYGY